MPRQGEEVLMDMIPTSQCCPPYQVVREVKVTQTGLPGGSKPQGGKVLMQEKKRADRSMRRVSKHATSKIWTQRLEVNRQARRILMSGSKAEFVQTLERGKCCWESNNKDILTGKVQFVILNETL